MNGLVKKTKPVSEEPGFAAPPSTDNGARAHDASAVTEQVSTLVEGITIQDLGRHSVQKRIRESL